MTGSAESEVAESRDRGRATARTCGERTPEGTPNHGSNSVKLFTRCQLGPDRGFGEWRSPAHPDGERPPASIFCCAPGPTPGARRACQRLAALAAAVY